MAQRKETKKTIKVRDLKPKKDAKGGVSPQLSTSIPKAASADVTDIQTDQESGRPALQSAHGTARNKAQRRPHCWFDPVVRLYICDRDFLIKK